MPLWFGWIAAGVLALFVVELTWAAAADAADRRAHESRFELKPFDIAGDLFTLSEYRDALKIYRMGSDNGTGYWASADGLWWDRRRDALVRVEPSAVRRGRVSQAFFTHVMYYGK
jgi:hypothetical protein